MFFRRLAMLFIGILFSVDYTAQQAIIVQPYLQNASVNSITIMWEGSNCAGGFVEWGTSPSLGNTNSVSSFNIDGSNCVFTCLLSGLSASTKYYYRVNSLTPVFNVSTYSAVFNFITPSLSEDESSVNILAMSDMQKDNSNPTKFSEIVNQGVIKLINDNYVGGLNENIHMVLIPGDLVDDGREHQEWVNDFFGQSANLFSYVPIYPVLGNHENNSTFFFNYFDLPKNGTTGFDEHWWVKDNSNIRIIGLDSNHDYQLPEQLDWLDSVLNSTLNDTVIDFVFAQLHHPHHSELWPPGNTDFTGDVISLMENFTSISGKPSIHFFGHTHGYSRGQSQDHNHLMVNVATAGGNIDYWDEYSQEDYPEYTVSTDDYGFVLVQANAGENPSFTLKRFSLGDEQDLKSNSLEDSITIKLNNVSPDLPVGIYPENGDVVSPDGFMLLGSSFNDADGDGHGASQWQISTDCVNFSSPVLDRWVQHENWYKGVNTQHGDDLLDVEVFNLMPDLNYCWRVRYRDKGLGWSNWSIPISFKTDSVFKNWKIYPNPIAQVSTLNIPYPKDSLLSINIFGANGKLIRNFTNISPPVFEIHRNGLKKGVYYLQVLYNNQKLGVVKFLVVDDG